MQKVDAGLLSSEFPSWQTGVNRNVAGLKTPRMLSYKGGAVRYRKITEKVAGGGCKAFKFT